MRFIHCLCFSSQGWLVSLGDGTHMDIFPKTKMRWDWLCNKDLIKVCRYINPQRRDLYTTTKHTFVSLLFMSQSESLINTVSFQWRSNTSNYLCKLWWDGISYIHGCTFNSNFSPWPGSLHNQNLWGPLYRKKSLMISKEGLYKHLRCAGNCMTQSCITF